MKAKIKKILGKFYVVVPDEYISSVKDAHYVDVEIAKWIDEGVTDAS